MKWVLYKIEVCENTVNIFFMLAITPLFGQFRHICSSMTYKYAKIVRPKSQYAMHKEDINKDIESNYFIQIM